MQKIVNLKPEDVIISGNYGIGKVEYICNDKFNVDFIDPSDWSFNFTCSEDLKWYQDNCHLADSEEAQMLADYIRRCDELLIEAEEYDEQFPDEWDIENDFDVTALEVGDYVLWHDGSLAQVKAIHGDLYWFWITDSGDPRNSEYMWELEFCLEDCCQYLPKQKALLHLLRLKYITYHNASTDDVCGAEEFYAAGNNYDGDWSDNFDDPSDVQAVG
ncbi:MAG: hypothetical protein J1F11_00155 [Oscillospiraceae bacterium]|nr:hypothetical protein [Oscillospiraceae bacterium]